MHLEESSPPPTKNKDSQIPKTVRIGVDTGGTFTDLVCLRDGVLHVHKLPSTPADPSQAILAGIREILSDSAPFEVTHGSTVATNAVLERRGARVALLTTAGFEDVLHIGRQTRPELYNFNVRRPDPLVPRHLIFGLPERLAADGSILEPIHEADVEAVIPKLLEHTIDSVAVGFLHSYINSQHEAQTAKILRSAGFLVSASHEILPAYREYERWSTTVVNAYVAPLMSRYLNRLQQELHTLDPTSTLRVMQSNGGSISAARAGSEAVQTILSGPAGGVVGAQAIGAASGYTRLITFDMGGTSTDVSLIDRYIGHTNESLVGDLPLALPVLDIHTVGAGGGSIAWIDSGSGLRVGPRSAGADPGPACCGKGNDLTVTDANLLLGRLDPNYFLGGRISLDLSRAQSIAQVFAKRIGLGARALAEGIVRIANANMAKAIRMVSVQRGFDPRDFSLLAFGGAGGLHVCELAASLDIDTVLVPQHSGVMSALGMLLADVTKEYSTSILGQSFHVSGEKLRERMHPLVVRAQTDLKIEGFAPDEIILIGSVAMRYRGQSFEIDVPLPPGLIDNDEAAEESVIGTLELDFHYRHAQFYGYSNPHRATEFVQLRLRAVGRTRKPGIAKVPERQLAAPAPDAIRPTVFVRRSTPTPIFHRNRLRTGMGSDGPAVIITDESTNVIPPGWTWRIDEVGTLIATHRESRQGRQVES